MNNVYKLSDEAIAALVKMLQLAMLTGTDISDWYRMVQLVPNEITSQLVLDSNYRSVLDSQINSLEQQACEMLDRAASTNEDN